MQAKYILYTFLKTVGSKKDSYVCGLTLMFVLLQKIYISPGKEINEYFNK